MESEYLKILRAEREKHKEDLKEKSQLTKKLNEKLKKVIEGEKVDKHYKKLLKEEREKHKEQLRLKAELTKKLREELKKEVRSRLFIALTTALGLVSALLWQTAITDTIKAFIPIQGAWTYELIVALIVTGIVAITIYFLSKVLNNGEKK